MTTLPRTAVGARLSVTAASALPRVSSTVAVTALIVASLMPSLLPRSAPVQAGVTGVFAVLGVVAGAGWRRLRGDRAAASVTVRGWVAAAALTTLGAALTGAARWQSGLRAATGLPDVGVAHWVLVSAGAVAVAASITGAAALLRSAARRLGRYRLIAGLLGCVLAVTSCTAPAVASADGPEPVLRQPTSPAMSGSTASPVGWESLGVEGRRFVTAPAADGVTRTYVGLDSAPDLAARVTLAVADLERSGGLTRSHLVIAVPTGSGWIDAGAIAGMERRFGGDVAEVAVQYSAAPSWVTFVFDRGSAEEAARALYRAVAHRVSLLPEDRRPRLHLYGQSLGAVGVDAALSEPVAVPACGNLVAGPPAGRVPTADTVVLANSSDPVVHWSPRLLVAPPRLAGVRPDAPTPAWLPVLSFLQTSVDLLTALDAAPGHGHRYGTDQGTRLPTC
ncbi:alpha/beta-hydrolase family protein [Rhodococcus sp. NPDC058505]|uniref:alpha/beta-hydrolase family protein n=1 Tax=Rhodococcus sp. NPDC058505 TaxID=3346531 RepID=UPI003656A617